MIPTRVPCNGRAKTPRGYEPMMHTNGSGRQNRYDMHTARLVKEVSADRLQSGRRDIFAT